jgi:hypothetical protein
MIGFNIKQGNRLVIGGEKKKGVKSALALCANV